MSEPLLVEREGGLVHLKLNRPQVLNALNQAMADALPDVTFVGRLATYRYYNMDQVVAQALATYRRFAR